MDFELVNSKYISTKFSNVFLGFFEGLFIDNEIKALIVWVETYPQSIQIPHFDNLYNVCIRAYENPCFLEDKKSEVIQIFKLFKKSEFFISGTADIQRLHGVLAGIICDKELRAKEVLALKEWMVQRKYLKGNFLYDDVFSILSPVMNLSDVTDDIKRTLINNLEKYLNIDDYGLPLLVVASSESVDNPDFFYQKIAIKESIICITGASERYSKNQWKELIESNGGVFTDSLTQKVNYLVVCNKGNPNWAHMSYGRKFEQAKKIQSTGNRIKLLTEDFFITQL